MSEPYRGVFGAGDLDAALAGLAEERRKFTELQEKIAATTTVVHAKDRVLSMTFDGRGELNSLTFNGTRYRRLAANELAKVIKETIAAGRKQAMEKVGEMMGYDLLPGIKYEDIASGAADLDKVVDSFLGVALDNLPDRVSGRARGLLQGEL